MSIRLKGYFKELDPNNFPASASLLFWNSKTILQAFYYQQNRVFKNKIVLVVTVNAEVPNQCRRFHSETSASAKHNAKQNIHKGLALQPALNTESKYN
jgi:hypothetical protein